MKTNQFVVAQVFLLLCASALATEYFVDANHGNDGWDGTSSNYVSGVIGPKKTLQAAADLIPNNDGHIITVLPGVYNEGGAVYPGDGFSLTNRLAISRKNVTIRSTGGKEVTHIVGAIDSEYADGCGPAAVRCVRGPGSDNGTVLIGFTLRDGHSGSDAGTKSEDRGGGAFDVYLYDCTISNCVSHTRGGAGNNCTFVRCRIIGNTAGTIGMACNSCSLANCLVARNYGSGATLTYMSKMVNTSVIGNTGGPALSNPPTAGTAVWNCFFAGNHEGQNGFDSAGHAVGAYCTKTVCERQAFFASVDETSVTNAALGQCVSSALGDAHLVPGSVALNRGDAADLGNIPLPAGYEQMDLDGNLLPDSGVINCGCFQQTVTPTGAKVSFNSDYKWDVGEPIPVNKYATHYFTVPAETLKVKPILGEGETMYGLYSDSENNDGKANYRIPMMDGYVRIFANPDPDFEILLRVQKVKYKYYVDAENGNDDWDGTSATFVSGTTGPKKTLAGVCAVANGNNYNLVYVAPGVYDDGTCDETVPSRLKVTKPIGFISSGGIGAATIKGGSQVRCAYLGAGNAFIQGFVLADGSSTADSDGAHLGAAVFASHMTAKILDCTITNCTAKSVILYRGTLQRSQVVDCTVQGGPLTWVTTCAASIFAGNRFGNRESADNCIFYERSAAYGCTVDAGGERVYAASATGAIGNIVVGRTAGDDNPAANYSDNVENVNPMFVSRVHRDFRLGEQSPALGAVAPASFASANASFFLTTDYYGNPLRAVNGRLTAGAVHNEPLPPIKGFVLVVR